MMRVYARSKNADGTRSWVVVETASNGDNSAVYLVALCQCLLLNLNESPSFANLGIPGQQSVEQQVTPDVYVARIQTYFSQFFASLIVAKVSDNPPTYNINAITFQGAKVSFALPANAAPPNQIPT
jgi:hypothetical protein